VYDTSRACLVTEVEGPNNGGLRLSQEPQAQINFGFSYLRHYPKI